MRMVLTERSGTQHTADNLSDPSHAGQLVDRVVSAQYVCRREHGPTLQAKRIFLNEPPQAVPLQGRLLMHPSLPTRPEGEWRRFCRTGAAHRPVIRSGRHLATTVLPARSRCAGTIRSTKGIFAHLQRRALNLAVFHACACCAASNSARHLHLAHTVMGRHCGSFSLV